MHTDGQLWKRIFAGLMIIIYLGGIFTPSLVYFAHDMYHVMTHTVYQHFLHQYQHFTGITHDHASLIHRHGHSHMGLIDFALHQVDHDESRQREKGNPMTLTTFKYNEHVKGNDIFLRRGYLLKMRYLVYNIAATDLSDPEPFTPPPKTI